MTTKSYTDIQSEKTDLLRGTGLSYDIGTGGDFETIKEAFDWLSTQHYTGEDYIIFNLLTQTHTISGEAILLFNFSGRLEVRGNNQTINIDIAEETGYYYVFDITGGGWIRWEYCDFVHINVNPWITFAYVSEIDYFQLYYSSVTGFKSIYWVDNCTADVIGSTIVMAPSGGLTAFYINSGYMQFGGSTIDNNTPNVGSIGFEVFGNGYLNLQPVSTISNFELAVKSQYFGKVTSNTITYTNNSTDFNPAANTYGNFGGIILTNVNWAG